MKTTALIAVTAALCLSACDKAADRTPSIAKSPTPVAGPEVPVPPGVHAVPAWAVGLMGKTFKDAYPGAPGDCLGNTDAINGKTDAGTEILGWGWDSAAAAVASRILLVEATGAIVGAGETGLPREDVSKAMPQVTSKTPGWSAFTTATAGEIKAYGLIAAGKSVCPLGGIKL